MGPGIFNMFSQQEDRAPEIQFGPQRPVDVIVAHQVSTPRSIHVDNMSDYTGKCIKRPMQNIPGFFLSGKYFFWEEVFLLRGGENLLSRSVPI